MLKRSTMPLWVVIADGDAHCAFSRPLSFRAYPESVADVFEGAVTLIEIKIVRRGVVRDQQIRRRRH